MNRTPQQLDLAEIRQRFIENELQSEIDEISERAISFLNKYQNVVFSEEDLAATMGKGERVRKQGLFYEQFLKGIAPNLIPTQARAGLGRDVKKYLQDYQEFSKNWQRLSSGFSLDEITKDRESIEKTLNGFNYLKARQVFKNEPILTEALPSLAVMQSDLLELIVLLDQLIYCYQEVQRVINFQQEVVHEQISKIILVK